MLEFLDPLHRQCTAPASPRARTQLIPGGRRGGVELVNQDEDK